MTQTDMLADYQAKVPPRYRLERFIGSGAAGTVFAALDTQISRQVAVKILKREVFAIDPASLKLEFELLSALSHPHILQVLDYGIFAESQPYMVSELVTAVPFPEFRRLAVPETVNEYLIQCSNALSYLHGENVIHGDIKPANLLLDGDPAGAFRVRLTDFGLAQTLKRGQGRFFGGTFPYIAPEALSGGVVDPRSDLFALGVVVAELITGKIPFGSPEEYRYLLQHPEETIRLEYSAGWKEIARTTEKLLNPDPNGRFLSARDLLYSLKPPRNPPSEQRGYLVQPRFTGHAELLRDVLARIETSGGTSFFSMGFTGPSGCGKSRLLREIEVQCRLREKACSRIVCRGRRLLEDVNNALLERQETRVDSVQAAVTAISGHGESSSWVILLDECHRTDAGSRESFAEILKTRPPGIILITGGDSCFDGGDRCVQIPDPSLKHAREMLKTRFVPQIDPEAVNRIVKLAGKLPGRLNRAVDFLVNRGNIFYSSGCWRWDPEVSVSYPAEETRLADLRLQTLTAREKEVLGAMACWDSGTGTEILCAVLGIPMNEFVRIQKRLLHTDILVQTDQGLEFSDKFLEDAARSSLTDTQRKTFHLEAAEMFKSIPGAEESAGRHFLEAGDPRKALPLLFDAANRIRKTGSLTGALEVYHLIRKTLSECSCGDGMETFSWKVNMERGNTLMLQGSWNRAAEAYQESLEALGPEGDALFRSQSLGNLARANFRLGNIQKTREVFESAKQLAHQAGNKTLEAEHALQLGNIHLGQNEMNLAGTWYREAIDLLRTAEQPRLLALAWNNLGIIYETSGDIDRALDSYRRAVPLKQKASDRRGEAILLHNIGNLLLERGWCKEARKCLEDAEALLSALGEIPVRAQLLTTLAALEIRQGCFDAARNRLEQSESLSRESRSEDAIQYALSERSRLLIEIGNHEAAYQLLRDICGTLPEDRPPTQDASALQRRLALACIRTSRSDIDPERLLVLAARVENETPAAAAERQLILSEMRAMRAGPESGTDPAQTALDIAREHKLGGMEAQACLVLAHLHRSLAMTEPALKLMCDENLFAFLTRNDMKPLQIRWLILSAVLHRETGHSGTAERLEQEADRLLREIAGHLPMPSEMEDFARDVRRGLTENDRTFPAPSINQEPVVHQETEMEDRRKLMLLLEVTRALGTEKTLDALLRSIVDRALELTESERGFCYLEAAGSDPEILVLRNIHRKDIFGKDSRISSSVLRKVMDTGQPVHIRDSLLDDEFKARQSILAWNLRTIMCAPLLRIDLTGENKVTGTAGVLYVDSTAAGSRFKTLEREVFEALAAHAAIGIENMRLRSRLTRENRVLKEKVAKTYRVGGIVGTSEPMLNVLRMIEKVTPSNANVLILGESGTGKELVARTIHFNGPRAQEAFLSINCAALSETILESELFGVEAGIATGVSRRQGLFVQAHRGTLFLDEVADMSAAMQAKILRVIQERTVRPVGGKQSIDIDVRILCATNRDLWKEVTEGNFREDLLYRLDVISIHIPPLRERPEDIPVLARHLFSKHAAKMNRSSPGIAPQTLEILSRYPWPGNARELENQIERALILADPNRSILPEDLSPRIRSGTTREGGQAESSAEEMRINLHQPLKTAVDNLEIRLIRHALRIESGNKVRAAVRLGLSREGLRLKMNRLDISASQSEPTKNS